MFTEETVFILGAGASYHYGYPTGERLVKLIIEKSEECIQIFEDHNDTQQIRDDHIPKFQLNNSRDKIISSCKKLIKHLKDTDATVIDYFLSKQSEEIQEIGKFIISWVILDCERSPLINSEGTNNNKNQLSITKKPRRLAGNF